MKEPKLDAKTQEYIKKWGRLEVPTAQITGGSVAPGTFPCLPVLGWIERREPVAIVGVHFLVLMRGVFKPMGTLSLAMSVSKTTELHINSFLHLIGWDGRIWPYDHDGGWPEGTDDEAQLKALLQTVRPHVGATMTFPSDPKAGAKTLPLPILKRTAPFPLAPFDPVPEDEEPPVRHLDRFRDLCKDPAPFELQN